MRYQFFKKTRKELRDLSPRRTWLVYMPNRAMYWSWPVSIIIFVVKPTDSQYFLDPNGAAEVHSFAFLQLVVIQYISFVASYIEMPERYYPKYWRGFMVFFGLVSCVFTIAAAIQLTAYDPELERIGHVPIRL